MLGLMNAQSNQPKATDLLFVGIRGSVVALSRITGQQIWAQRLGRGYIDFVNVVVDGDHVFAATRGELHCLDAASGRAIWHNPLKGFGMGLATIAASAPIGNPAALLEQRRREHESSAAATVGNPAS
jgi:outer membrane protein assembly factor BamB